MKDLTDSSIVKNILQMALPIAAGMFFQTLYFLIDLYFVAGLGDAAIAVFHFDGTKLTAAAPLPTAGIGPAAIMTVWP